MNLQGGAPRDDAKVREVLIMQRTGNFTCSVRTEIEENHTVPGSDFAIYAVNSEGFNKLIRYTCGIGCFYAAAALAALPPSPSTSAL